METVTLKINGKSHTLEDVMSDMPLLWAIRDLVGLTGTKYGVWGWTMWRLYGTP